MAAGRLAAWLQPRVAGGPGGRVGGPAAAGGGVDGSFRQRDREKNSMNRFVFALAFATGLLSVGWVAWGFVGTSWVALLMTGVIAGAYLLGALEVRRFRAATQALQEALAGLTQAPAELSSWLQQLPLALRHAVRLRVEGERAALPGLALTPYLVGLLVMLGMLGTFLGMVITFKGAVFALEGSTDLQAIRSALAAPIKGLGLSFGTSVAGVAASAMLGLLAALSRRERLQVSRLLDSRVADVLRPFSLSHQREQTYKALQGQSQALPVVADRLQALMEQLEQRSERLNEQQLAEGLSAQFSATVGQVSAHWQQALQQQAQTGAELMQGLDQSLNAFTTGFEQRSLSLVEGVHEALRLSRGEQAQADQQRLQAWSQGLDGMTQALQIEWRQLGAQQLAQQQAVCTALESTAARLDERHAEQASRLRSDLDQVVARFEQLAQARLDAEAQAQAEQVAADRQRLEAWGQALGSVAQSLQGEWQRVGEQALAQQQALSHTLEQTAAAIGERSAEQAARTRAETSRLLSRLDALAQARSEAEIRSQAEQEAADRQRLAAWSQALGSMAGTLQAEWQRVGEQALAGQQQLCQTLEKTAGELGERSAEQARRTLADMTALVARQDELSLARSAAEERWLQQQGERMDQLAALWRQELGALRDDEARRGDAAVQRLGDLQAALASQLATLGQTLEAPMARLMQSAAEVPQAATALLAQVREQMGALDQRDQQALQERSGLMERLNQLLLSLEQASAEQRDSVQALLGQALGTLGQAGQQFTETLSSHAVRAEDLAVHLRGGAIELSSLGEAFHQGVQLFSSSNEKLAEGLQRVETAITQSMARSDEQLAYYVAQAREVIDLSISAQRGIVDDLRRLQAGAQTQAAALGSA